MKSEIQFEKYKKRGADYHYKQINKANLKTYRPSVDARYQMHINIIKEAFQKKDFNRKQEIKILDVGCGDGVLLYLINKKLKNYNLKFYGIDLSEEALKVAKKKINNGIFKQTDAYNILFPDNYFDFVISSDVIEHVNHPNKMLTDIQRVTKQNGEVIIGTPIRFTEKPLDKMHSKEFFQIEFKELMSSFFSNTKLYESHDLFYILNYQKTINFLGLKFGLTKYTYNFLALFGKNLFLKTNDNKNTIYSYMFVSAKKIKIN